MEIKNIIQISIILITLGLLCSTVSATPVDVTYLNGIMKPNHIVIAGATSDNGTVEIKSETSINVTVSDNHFEYIVNDYKIPGMDEDDTLTIETFPVESAATLTLGKTILIWNMDIVNTTIPITSGNAASYTSPNFNKTARYISDKLFGIDIANHLKGKTINLKINGTSSASEVTIKFIGKRTIVADGKFSTSIKTDGFPDGTYTITANNGDEIGINKTIVTLPYVAPPSSKGGNNKGGSGEDSVGRDINIISGTRDTGDAGEGTPEDAETDEVEESSGEPDGEATEDSTARGSKRISGEPETKELSGKLLDNILGIIQKVLNSFA